MIHLFLFSPFPISSFSIDLYRDKKSGTGAEGGAMGADHDGVAGVAAGCLLRCSGVLI